jgi:2-oxoglutarate/2-oxoacid ferredoxin oxidoreductase subunit beta
MQSGKMYVDTIREDRIMVQDSIGSIKKYLRKQFFPTIWCAGCGNGIVMHAILRAIDNLKFDKNDVVMVSGIGCSSRTPGYVDFNTLHTAHGRAIPFASGVKLANPKFHVIVITGDGDATAIGGNHFIHAARRNIDITVVLFNNYIYGMTGGQGSPTTPRQSKSTTTPYGNIDNPFDICKLAEAAGATYVARGTAYHASNLHKLIEDGITNKGFSLVEVIVNCHTYYGRPNDLKNPIALLKWQKDHAIAVKAAAKLPPEKLEGKFLTGVLVDNKKPEFCESYQELVKRVRVDGGK